MPVKILYDVAELEAHAKEMGYESGEHFASVYGYDSAEEMVGPGAELVVTYAVDPVAYQDAGYDHSERELAEAVDQAVDAARGVTEEEALATLDRDAAVTAAAARYWDAYRAGDKEAQTAAYEDWESAREARLEAERERDGREGGDEQPDESGPSAEQERAWDARDDDARGHALGEPDVSDDDDGYDSDTARTVLELHPYESDRNSAAVAAVRDAARDAAAERDAVDEYPRSDDVRDDFSGEYYADGDGS